MPDLNNSLRRGDKSHNQRATQALQRAGERDLGNDGHVGGLVSAVGQVDAGRRFRGSADPEQDDIRLLEVFGQLPVIVHHREIQGVDPLEIVGVQHVLRARARRRVLTQIRLEQCEDRAEDGKARRSRRLATRLQTLRELRIDKREQHNSRRILDFRDHAIELRGGSDERVHVFDGSDALILRGRRARVRLSEFLPSSRTRGGDENSCAPCPCLRLSRPAYIWRPVRWTDVDNSGPRQCGRSTRLFSIQTVHSRRRTAAAGALKLTKSQLRG